jgi:SAM-dependent methyltransferase
MLTVLFTRLRQHALTSYTDHGTSLTVKAALGKCLAQLPPGSRGLQVGSGTNRLHPAIFNLDLTYNRSLDCCGRAENLPFRAASFSLIVSQEVLEHVKDPNVALEEMYRVLSRQGLLYCQVPFIIGYHPGPTDFWRFSRQGIREIVEKAGFVCAEVGIAVGPCYGFYRIAVEFGAVIGSSLIPRLYKPIKGLLALVLAPIKWLDPLMRSAAQADRVAGGYFVIAYKE